MAGVDDEDANGAFTRAPHLQLHVRQNATGELELYDLLADPYQLDNQINNPVYDAVEAGLASGLATLRGCAGRTAGPSRPAAEGEPKARTARTAAPVARGPRTSSPACGARAPQGQSA